jgi:hypothetical protein
LVILGGRAFHLKKRYAILVKCPACPDCNKKRKREKEREREREREIESSLIMYCDPLVSEEKEDMP